MSITPLLDSDEFAELGANAAEWDIPIEQPPTVHRGAIEIDAGRWLSYIKWGPGTPRVSFLHGGGQNAHTWDTVALALGIDAIAFDLPGHGHSFRRADRDYRPWANATTIANAIERLAPDLEAVVGMSLGGATTIRLAAERPDLCRRAVVVDVTPQVNDPNREMTTMERGSVSLISGPPTYNSREEMEEAAVALSPYRGAEGVRRGVRHNSYRRPDGKWAWRYDLFGERAPTSDGRSWSDFTPLWDDVDRITIPTVLVRGGLSKFVLDEDEAEMCRRLPSLKVETVEGAGHAVQSDRPLELVRIIKEHLR